MILLIIESNTVTEPWNTDFTHNPGTQIIIIEHDFTNQLTWNTISQIIMEHDLVFNTILQHGQCGIHSELVCRTISLIGRV